MGQVTEDGPPEHGEVLPPEDAGDDDSGRDTLNILALVRNYTNRPDLFLSEVEKHDPGFIKQINRSSAAHSARLREGKFNFGKWQAYTSLGIRVFAAVVVLVILAYAVIAGSAGFFTIIALAIFYAVTQSGMSGFSGIASALSKAVMRLRKDDGRNR